MKDRVLVCCILFVMALEACHPKTSSSSTPSAQLTIIQGDKEFPAGKNGGTIELRSMPFRLKFDALNTEAVFLHASSDSLCFTKASAGKWKSLNSFNSAQTYSEPERNSDREIYVGENEEAGYHCLFALPESGYVRFDSVVISSAKKWTGIRTVKQLAFLDYSSTIPCESMNGRVIYLTFSPGVEKQGYGVRLRFR